MINPEKNNNYGASFFKYTSEGSEYSAKIIVPIVLSSIPGVGSVADFGCAQGVWLKEWMSSGITQVVGVDGNYVDRQNLKIPPQLFFPNDLNKPINLGKKFDLVTSLEVAEHLNPESSKSFVETLVNHSDIVLFSAAPPGQGGENHINEKSYNYWAHLFEEFGYVAHDCIRPQIIDDGSVSYWYRYNLFVYANKNGMNKMSPEAKEKKVLSSEIIDVSPPLFKLRKILLKNFLPSTIQNQIARLRYLILKYRRP